MNRDGNHELNELGLNAEERSKMERLLAEFREESKERAERPELFWTAQQTRINAHLRSNGNAPQRMVWVTSLATSAAIVVVLAVSYVTMLSVPPHQKHRGTTTPVTATVKHANVDDEALLRSIDDTTNSSVPDALAPANILASEMDRGLEGASKNTTGRNNE